MRKGEGVDERAVAPDGAVVVRVDPRYFRPAEVETLLGDAGKAHDRLGWKAKTSFEELVAEIEKSIAEIIDFIDVEIGDGSAKGEDSGLFNLGAGMPATSRVGILQPTPLHGNVSVSEPTTDAPPDIPPDSADQK